MAKRHPKRQCLQENGALHRQPDRVRARLFEQHRFFEPLDKGQVKYERLRDPAGARGEQTGHRALGRLRKRALKKRDFQVTGGAMVEEGHPRAHVFVEEELASGSCEVLKIEAHLARHFTKKRAFSVLRPREGAVVRNTPTTDGSGKKTREKFSHDRKRGRQSHHHCLSRRKNP